MTAADRLAQSDLHNKLAGEIVASIVRPPLTTGGTTADVMVLLESVVLGVFLACVRLGGDEAVLDSMVEAVKARAAQQRLGNLPTGGTA